MITGMDGTSKKLLGLISWELKFSAAYVTDKHKGTAFAKKFKEAVVMAKKHNQASRLNWESDPRLSDLSRSLKALGWIRAH